MARNLRLLVQAGAQHLIDDPVLFVVQVSRRMPLSARSGLGVVLRRVGITLPGGEGIAALGAYMAGNTLEAARIARTPTGMESRLRGEVAVLLDFEVPLGYGASAETRARAVWSHGELNAALEILEGAGRGEFRYARRLRSEIALLQPGKVLSPPNYNRDQSFRELSENLRVLHLVTNSLPHTQSGYSLRTHRILTSLREIGAESVAVTRTGYPVMIGAVAARDEDIIDGVRYVRVFPRSLPQTQEERLDRQVERAIELANEVRPHILHATTNYYNALVAQAVSAATGIPWVLEVRGLMEQTWIASHGSEISRSAAAASEKTRLIAAREGELAAAADAVVTLGRGMAEELIARGVPADSITLVPNGIDESLLAEELSPEQARAQISLEIPQGAFVVGAVSALVEYEGFDVLLRAVAAILDDPIVPSALKARLHVLLAGDGSAAPGLLDLARRLGIAERVHLPGRVPRGEAKTWVQALDVVTIPRLDREVTRTVTPQKPIEAMALSRPVVVSDLPALRETVTDAKGNPVGRLFPAEDAIALANAVVTLAEDDAGRREVGQLGRALAEQRTWDVLMRRYDSLYRQVSRTDGGGVSGGE